LLAAYYEFKQNGTEGSNLRQQSFPPCGKFLCKNKITLLAILIYKDFTFNSLFKNPLPKNPFQSERFYRGEK